MNSHNVEDWRLSDLAAAYERFDTARLRVLSDLLDSFKASLNFSEERLKVLVDTILPGGPEPGEDDDEDIWEQYRSELEVNTDLVRDLLARRACLLARKLSQEADAYAGTFARVPDHWRAWRRDGGTHRLSQFVHSLDDEQHRLLLTANNIAIVTGNANPEGILAVPTDGDLREVGGAVQVEHTEEFSDWEELLPECAKVNAMGLLWVAWEAAAPPSNIPARQLHPDATRREVAEIMEYVRLLPGMNETMNRMIGLQEAGIDHLERMVALMQATDKYSCEERLKELMPETYSHLCPAARALLIGSQQVAQTRDFASPTMIVAATASAFERQLKHEFLPLLVGHMGQANQPSRSSRPDRMTLGDIASLLGDDLDAVLWGDFAERYGYRVVEIRGAIVQVKEDRNRAAHGATISFVEAEAIRQRWISGGGVFRALLRHR